MSHFKKTFMTAVIIGTLALTNHSAIAGMLWNDFNNEQLASIKIDISDAIARVKEMQSGTVVQAKLEKEDGILVYKVELIDNEKEIKALVDAVSGNITIVQ